MFLNFLRIFVLCTYSLFFLDKLHADDENAFLRKFRKKNIPTHVEEHKNPLDKLRDKGVNFTPAVIGSTAWDVAGGRKRTTDGNFEYLLDLNLKLESKLLHYPGGTLCADFQTHQGGSPMKDAGSFEFISLIEAPNFTQLSELWYKQSFYNDFFWFKIGKNDCSIFFDYANNGSFFQNGGFEGISTIRDLPSYPSPAMGVLAVLSPVSCFSLKAGLYDGSLIQGVNTGVLGVFGKFFDHLHRHAFIIGEADFNWNITSPKLDGRIGIGAWRNTARIPKYSGGTQKGVQGGYLVIDQTVWNPQEDQNDTRHIGVFAQYGFTSTKANPVGQAIAVGCCWTGINPKWKHDKLGFGTSMERFSLEPGSGFVKPAEVDMELFYVFIPRKWINIQPDIQYIINPGGSGVPNALVLLLDVAIAF